MSKLAHSNDETMAKIEEDARKLDDAGYVDEPQEPRRTLADGTQIYPEHTRLKSNGQQEGYQVLAEEERAKGFVRPYRESYIHEKCGTSTRMGRTIAETYARNPFFYSGTFCCHCGTHFPIGPKGEFHWEGSSEKVGT